jgi:hypothetical protein
VSTAIQKVFDGHEIELRLFTESIDDGALHELLLSERKRPLLSTAPQKVAVGHDNAIEGGVGYPLRGSVSINDGVLHD